MATYYGIEESTDSKCPRTKVTRLPSRKAAEAFSETKTHLTYADPAAARNYHHTLYCAFEMPAGWRPPSKKETQAAIEEHYRFGSRSYPLDAAIYLARAIWKAGTPVVAEKASAAR